MNALDIDHSTSVDGATLSFSATPVMISRACPHFPTPTVAAAWSFGNFFSGGYIVTVGNLVSTCGWPMTLPHGAVLTGLMILVQGSGGGLPSPMPSFTVVSVDSVGTTTVEVPETFDTSPDVPSYVSLHYISVSGLSVTINADQLRYMIRFDDGGAPDGLQVYQPRWTFTTTALDPG